MTSFFFKKQNNDEFLKETVKFNSKLDQNLLKKKSIFSVLEKDPFIKENFDKFLFTLNKDQYQIIFDKNQYQSYLNLANSILDSCDYYNWDDIWIKFKIKIYDISTKSNNFNYSIIFKWILLLVYLNENQKIDLEDFFRVHKEFKEEFEVIGLMLDNHFKNKSVQFDQEISLDIDKLDNLYLKIKKFLIQLDDFFINNFSFIINELSFKYENLKEKIKSNNYYFDLKFLDQLIDSSNENQKYLTEFTTLNNLNLPINYIFIKYLVDNNFLCFQADLIEKFCKKIKIQLKIVDISSLKVKIFKFLKENGAYKKIGQNYIFLLDIDFYFDNSSFEKYIIKDFEYMIDDFTRFCIPFPEIDSFKKYL